MYNYAYYLQNVLPFYIKSAIPNHLRVDSG